jgi:hypothetical protein
MLFSGSYAYGQAGMGDLCPYAPFKMNPRENKPSHASDSDSNHPAGRPESRSDRLAFYFFAGTLAIAILVLLALAFRI